MTTFNGYAATDPGAPLVPHTFEPPPLGPHDVELEVTHCGICHSDIHLVDDDWGISSYPLVPGHEVVGVVRDVGAAANLPVGTRVGVGWQNGACLSCAECVDGHENLCQSSRPTCVGRPGGFADRIRVDGRFAFPIPDGLESDVAAPLLCGGVTVFSPLHRYVQAHHRVGVVGIGGLGHMGIRFAAAMGAGVTAFSGSPDKAVEARGMGADEFCSSRDSDALRDQRGRFDVILSTVNASLDWSAFLSALRPGGTLVLVGAPAAPLEIPANLLLAERAIAGSMIGGRTSMRRMLDFAERAELGAMIERYTLDECNDAMDRLRNNEVRYRAVMSA